MTVASMTEDMSPQLLRVAERARQEPEGKFHSLAHLIDVECLARAFHRIRSNAAVGIDGVTKELYAAELAKNLEDLHGRMREGRYRHQPIRRVHIPKEGSQKTRPIGISCLEDKIVQGALGEVLGAIYEQDFLDCSYGFRPGRSAHDAIRELENLIHRGEVNFVLEADIVSFFDSLDRTELRKMLQERVADGSMLRLIGKCLHVGVLEGEEFHRPEAGTAQGSALSPLLGNVYLHYVLDEWFEKQIKPRLAGRAFLVRYADDFALGFELEADARRVEAVLGKRLGRYGLKLHPTKTRLLSMRRPPSDRPGGKGEATFDFLGFTFYWRRSRKGRWVLGCKTMSARLSRAIRRVYDWCRRHRHEPVKDQHSGLRAKLLGHFHYFCVNGNDRAPRALHHYAKRAWCKWLGRRSQRSRFTWQRFNDLLRDFPLPTPRVFVQIWGVAP
jgi:group II intron reverse transcriptase/maturase